MRAKPRFSSRRWSSRQWSSHRWPNWAPGWGMVASFQWLPVELLMLAMLIVQATPYSPWKSCVQTALAMGSIFYWARNRPASMPPAAAFMVGLLHDLLGATPLGVGVLAMLLAQCGGELTAEKQRLSLMGKGWIKGWILFIPVTIAAAFLIWLVISVLSAQLLPLSAPLKQGGTVLIFYPVVAFAWSLFQRLIERPDYA